MPTMNSLLLPLILAATSPAFAQDGVQPNLINSAEPFAPDGKVELLKTNLIRTVEINKVERGVLNGVHYEFYYSDGSGTFTGTAGNTGQISEPRDSNWDVGCKKDPVTDKKSAYMHRKNLWIWAYPGGKVTVSIGHNHYPRSTVAIRIDSGTPVSHFPPDDGAFSPQTSVKIIKQLKGGKVVTTRFMKWPYRSWVDDTYELYGFNETFKYITWAVQRIK